jgi:DUF2914 family protein
MIETVNRLFGEAPLAPLASGLRRYERHLSAMSMISGFGFDNYYFGRIDHPATQLVLFAYVSVAVASILFLHFIESRTEPDDRLKKIRWLPVAATQFAFGGLWSAFLIFYGRSAVIAASWPFLIVLAAILVGSELFRKYRLRLAFTCTLLCFALFSYMIFAVPVFTGRMGPGVFLLSGILAIVAFSIFLHMLWRIGPARIKASWRGIAFGAFGVIAGINGFYFANILPPLPLALANAGVFHSVTKDGDIYRAVAEPRSWIGAVNPYPVMHVAAGESLSLYSAVFAPIELHTKIVHIWQRYDQAAKMWRVRSIVSYPITGGRDGGYRGYSIKSTPANGEWRVDIATPDGLLIGRVEFSVVSASGAVPSVVRILK